MSQIEKDEIRGIVRSRYQEIAVQTVGTDSCSCSTESACCSTPNVDGISAQMGYSEEELAAIPEGANLGLGCGNPQAIAALQQGETVVDLGSGGGFDCFLASRQVGESGRVIGVDMTPEMISRARLNAVKSDFTNTEFRLGEIEHLPVADGTVDVVISNCVINLSPDKQQVFNEVFRVLKDGGRIAVSDIVMTAELPESIRSSADALAGCVSGAATVEQIESMLTNAGFQEIRIEPKDESRTFIKDWIPGLSIDNYIVSAVIQAVKR